MAKSSYFESRPDVVRVFEDLEALHDFCRFELLPFNAADLYNKQSQVWRAFDASRRPRKWESKNKFENRQQRPQFRNKY